jgi:hypothetical protein
MNSAAQASCTMTSSELDKATHEHLEFASCLLASIQARRMFESELEVVSSQSPRFLQRDPINQPWYEQVG